MNVMLTPVGDSRDAELRRRGSDPLSRGRLRGLTLL